MRVTRLSLADFRSYPDLDLAFAPGVTTLVGRNGAGKTNVVEAVRYLSALSSHRSASDAPLVRSGATSATVRGRIEKAGRAVVVEATIGGGKGRGFRLNGSAASARDVQGILRTVVFSPEDLDLVKGDPASRRRFLDDLVLALAPSAAGDIADYDRIVRQRTALLKSARGRPAESDTLDVWDEKLASVGARVADARLRAAFALEPWFRASYADISGGGRATLEYQRSWPGESTDLAAISAELAAAVAASRARELERGVCLVGPHRDDLVLTVGELPARGYASHGESWSAALALRLGSYDLLTADGGPDADPDGEPVLLLDDVFAELDGPRRDALARRVAAAHQTIITAAVGDDVPATLADQMLYVRDGRVTPEPDGDEA